MLVPNRRLSRGGKNTMALNKIAKRYKGYLRTVDLN